MSETDYDERVRVLSFDASDFRRSGGALRRNASFVTTLAKAVRLVCSDEWAADGNVLNGILRADGTVIGADEAHEMMAAPGFPPT
jgi:hypothetical protein